MSPAAPPPGLCMRGSTAHAPVSSTALSALFRQTSPDLRPKDE